MTINKERIQLWVDALESGQYKQTQQRLHDSYGRCCLGVACQVAIDNGLNIEVRPLVKTKNDDDFQIWEYDGLEDVLPESVVEWFGLPNSNPTVDSEVGEFDLATLNDEEGLKFPEIAEAVRATYL